MIRINKQPINIDEQNREAATSVLTEIHQESTIDALEFQSSHLSYRNKDKNKDVASTQDKANAKAKEDQITPAQMQAAAAKTEHLEKLARSLTGDQSLKVIPGSWWAHDPKNNTIHVPQKLMLENTDKEVLSLLIHEIGHHEYTMDLVEQTAKQLGINPKDKKDALYYHSFHRLWNAIEDARVDTYQMSRHRGATEFYKEWYTKQFTPESSKKQMQRIAEKMAKKKNITVEQALAQLEKKGTPLSEQFGLGLLYQWSQKHFFNKEGQYAFVKDQKVLDLLKKLQPYINDATSTWRDISTKDLNHREKMADAKSSMATIRDIIWPEFKQFVEEDIENMKEMLKQMAENNSQSGQSGEAGESGQSSQSGEAGESEGPSGGMPTPETDKSQESGDDSDSDGDSSDQNKDGDKSEGSKSAENSSNSSSSSSSSSSEQDNSEQQGGSGSNNSDDFYKDLAEEILKDLNKEQAEEMGSKLNNPQADKSDQSKASDKSDDSSIDKKADKAGNDKKTDKKDKANKSDDKGDDGAKGTDKANETAKPKSPYDLSNDLDDLLDETNIQSELKKAKELHKAMKQIRDEHIKTEYQELQRTMGKEITELKGLVENIFIKNTFATWDPIPYKSGVRWNRKHAMQAKYKAKATGIVDPSPRIWDRRVDPEKRSVEFVYALDWSGSMSGYPQEQVKKALVMFMEVCADVEIPYGIVAFHNDAAIIKDNADEYSREDRFSVMPALDKFGSGGTEDIKGLKKSILLLQESQADQRIIFFLTDGSGSKPEEMKKLVEQCESEYGIKVIGIGINGESMVNDVYQHSAVVRDLAKLPQTLGQLLENEITDTFRR